MKSDDKDKAADDKVAEFWDMVGGIAGKRKLGLYPAPADLVADAAKASERFGDDSCEEYAEERKKRNRQKSKDFAHNYGGPPGSWGAKRVQVRVIQKGSERTDRCIVPDIPNDS